MTREQDAAIVTFLNRERRVIVISTTRAACMPVGASLLHVAKLA